MKIIDLVCKHFVTRLYRNIRNESFEAKPIDGGLGLPSAKRIYANMKIKGLKEITQQSEVTRPAWMEETIYHTNKLGGLVNLMMSSYDEKKLGIDIDMWTKDALKWLRI